MYLPKTRSFVYTPAGGFQGWDEGDSGCLLSCCSECNSNRDSVLSYTSVRSNSSYLGSDEMGSGERNLGEEASGECGMERLQWEDCGCSAGVCLLVCLIWDRVSLCNGPGCPKLTEVPLPLLHECWDVLPLLALFCCILSHSSVS